VGTEVQAAIAHTREDGSAVQTVIEHLEGVADLASRFVSPFCDPAWGRLVGRWHDLGKFSAEFQQKIRAENGFDEFSEADTSGRRVDHSTAGALLARAVFGDTGGAAFVSDAIAAVVAGHHSGLPDLVGQLDARLQAKRDLLEKAKAGKPPPCLLSADRPPAPACIRATTDTDSALRDWELWVRFLFSALVDADSLDTEKFCNPGAAEERGAFPAVSELAGRLDEHLDALRSRDGPVAEARRRVQDAVRSGVGQPQGVFTLTVPTGGGKTLASLLFGLRHAAAHRLDRVIVVPPFTSIIEQTAEVFRGAVGADAVVEHHSALDPKNLSRRGALAAENWDAPVIVTTAVQFFESLFANRRSRCRKLHNIARSVVVLDEAQTLPPKLLAPILDVLQALVCGYGVSLVLSTATMPALGRRERFPHGFARSVELAPDPTTLAADLRRVDVRWPEDVESPEPMETLAARIAAEPRALAIVHRKSDAVTLVRELDRISGAALTHHLSGNMCPAHRSAVLAQIRDALARGADVRVVATQLIEAGVDVDFPVVFRALAGLDSLAQAAGRCNREGRLGRGRLEVFVPMTSPPPGAPTAGAAVTRELLASDRALDLFSPRVHQEFFKRLYATQQTDQLGVQALRSSRAFAQVAEKVSLIDDGSTDLIVPWGFGAALLEDLRCRGPDRSLLRRLQRFNVRVAPSIHRKLVAAGALEEVASSVTALSASHRELYTERFGLLVGEVVAADADAFVV
jgi:CRISPR-associated endonuclease/helicase Cas3